MRNQRETIWSRGQRDTEAFRGSFTWWLVELMGAVVFAAIAVPQLPDEPSDLLVVVYAGLGIAAGLLASYLLVYLWNVAWAAARQRNEAWMDLDAATVAAQKRDSYERALAVLSGYAQLGALILEEIYDCFQVSPLPAERWETAHRAWATWVVDMKQVIQGQCPQYLGEFESFPVGGDFFSKANGRRDRLAEIMRQLRLTMERS